MKSLILKELKNHYNFKKDVDFARFLNITPQMLSNWDSRGSFDYNILYTKCVDVSADWILSKGQGQMLRENYVENESETKDSILPISNNDHLSVKIPIVELSFISNIIASPDKNNFEEFDYLMLPHYMLPLNSMHMCVQEREDSMSPTICKTDKVIIRLLDKSEWLEMPNEHVYVVIDKKGDSFLKRIKNRFYKGFIVCMSDNVDKANYPNFTIKENDILNIWHVELHISANMTNVNDNYHDRLKVVEENLATLTETVNRVFL